MAGPLGAQGPGVERDDNTSRHIPAGEPKDPGGVTVRASEEGKVSSPPEDGEEGGCSHRLQLSANTKTSPSLQTLK